MEGGLWLSACLIGSHAARICRLLKIGRKGEVAAPDSRRSQRARHCHGAGRQVGSGDRAEYPQAGRVAGAGPRAQETADGGSTRQPDQAATAVSTRDQLQPWVGTKQAYPGVGVFLLATGAKVLAVIAIQRSDITVGVGTVENGALAVRQ
jgi:hypothetical protein